jgi:hypothetical protein
MSTTVLLALSSSCLIALTVSPVHANEVEEALSKIDQAWREEWRDDALSKIPSSGPVREAFFLLAEACQAKTLLAMSLALAPYCSSGQPSYVAVEVRRLLTTTKKLPGVRAYLSSLVDQHFQASSSS